MQGSQVIDGEDCWWIEMIAISRNVLYPKQIIKGGKTDYILRAAEYYARSGRLLKIIAPVQSVSVSASFIKYRLVTMELCLSGWESLISMAELEFTGFHGNPCRNNWDRTGAWPDLWPEGPSQWDEFYSGRAV